MAVLEIYCDESGTHKGSEYLIVGGAIANKTAWRTLESRWNAVLKKNDVRMFHANEFLRGEGDFKGWDDIKKRAFALKLAKIMNEEMRQFFGCTVRPTEYKQIASEFPTSLTDYKFCVERCLMLIMDWAKQRKKIEPISIFFERGPKIHGEIFEMYDEAVRRYPELRKKIKLASLTLLEKYTTDQTPIVGLQVADYIAYGLYQIHCSLIQKTWAIKQLDLISFLSYNKIISKYDTPKTIRHWLEQTMEGRKILRPKR